MTLLLDLGVALPEKTHENVESKILGVHSGQKQTVSRFNGCDRGICVRLTLRIWRSILHPSCVEIVTQSRLTGTSCVTVAGVWGVTIRYHVLSAILLEELAGVLS